ncbi:hypothetical protein ABH926_009087 [Catenulispora sp. GP43]|uniref:hypothetical protein n=1 Tax=Catenulispora sp. GP43 TaxID=3156263 RepID=UPI0035195D9F
MRRRLWRSGTSSDEPDAAFDENCRMRRMRYLLRLVVDNAADNDVLEADRVDIMSALAVARERCREDDVELCQLFIHAVGSLARFLGYRNALKERVTWGRAALDVAELLGDDLAIAELCASTIAWPLLQIGDYPETERYCLQGLEAARRCDDSPAAARWAGNAARSLSGIARDANDGPTARYWAEQVAIYARQSGDGLLERGARLDFGFAALLQDEFEEAEHLFTGLLEFENRGDDTERIANRSGETALAIMNRALRSDTVEEETRLCQHARANLERSLELGIRINHAVVIAECEISLAVLARIQGDDAEYQRLIASGRRRFADLGIRRMGRAEQFVRFPEARA